MSEVDNDELEKTAELLANIERLKDKKLERIKELKEETQS